jgi:hypothetical protein
VTGIGEIKSLDELKELIKKQVEPKVDDILNEADGVSVAEKIALAPGGIVPDAVIKENDAGVEVILPMTKTMTQEEKELRIIEIDNKLQELAEEAEILASERKKLAEAVISSWEQSGKQNINANGRTLYLHGASYVTVNDSDRARAMRVLKKMGLGIYISKDPTFNTNEIRGWYNDAVKNGTEVPKVFFTAFSVGTNFSLRSQKAKGKRK